MATKCDEQLHDVYMSLGAAQAGQGQIAEAADAYALALYYAKRIGSEALVEKCRRLILAFDAKHMGAQAKVAPLYFAQLLIRYPVDRARQMLKNGQNPEPDPFLKAHVPQPVVAPAMPAEVPSQTAAAVVAPSDTELAAHGIYMKGSDEPSVAMTSVSVPPDLTAGLAPPVRHSAPTTHANTASTSTNTAAATIAPAPAAGNVKGSAGTSPTSAAAPRPLASAPLIPPYDLHHPLELQAFPAVNAPLARLSTDFLGGDAGHDTPEYRDPPETVFGRFVHATSVMTALVGFIAIGFFIQELAPALSGNELRRVAAILLNDYDQSALAETVLEPASPIVPASSLASEPSRYDTGYQTVTVAKPRVTTEATTPETRPAPSEPVTRAPSAPLTPPRVLNLPPAPTALPPAPRLPPSQGISTSHRESAGSSTITR